MLRISDEWFNKHQQNVTHGSAKEMYLLNFYFFKKFYLRACIHIEGLEGLKQDIRSPQQRQIDGCELPGILNLHHLPRGSFCKCNHIVTQDLAYELEFAGDTVQSTILGHSYLCVYVNIELYSSLENSFQSPPN